MRKVKSARTKKERRSKEPKGSPKKERSGSMIPGAQQLDAPIKTRSQSMVPGAQHAEFLTATPGKIKRERAGSIKMSRKGSARRSTRRNKHAD